MTMLETTMANGRGRTRAGRGGCHLNLLRTERPAGMRDRLAGINLANNSTNMTGVFSNTYIFMCLALVVVPNNARQTG
jgi:hypothetical protein